jgi:hypothetical protein
MVATRVTPAETVESDFAVMVMSSMTASLAVRNVDLSFSPCPDAPLTGNFGEHPDPSEALVISQTNGYDVSQH